MIRCTIDACMLTAAFCATHADYDLSGTQERDALRAAARALLDALPACACVSTYDGGHFSDCVDNEECAGNEIKALEALL